MVNHTYCCLVIAELAKEAFRKLIFIWLLTVILYGCAAQPDLAKKLENPEKMIKADVELKAKSKDIQDQKILEQRIILFELEN